MSLHEIERECPECSSTVWIDLIDEDDPEYVEDDFTQCPECNYVMTNDRWADLPPTGEEPT